MAAVALRTRQDDAAFLNHVLDAMWTKTANDTLDKPSGRPKRLHPTKPANWVAVLPGGLWGTLAPGHAQEKLNQLNQHK